jgi:hypothetical protein
VIQTPSDDAGLSPSLRQSNMRIGFLFNHDQIHQIAHSLPIALALAEIEPSVEVVVATTNKRLRAEVDRIVKERGVSRAQFVDLRPRSILSRAAVKFLDSWLPAAKLAVYRDHLAFFSTLDALVVAEKTSAILKTRYGLSELRLIHTRHGAGDRAIGFDPASARFDLVLVSGPKIRDRLINDANLAPDRLAMVGYPKFDLVPAMPPRLPLQANGRPTVLYSPHVSPHLSSWYRDGRAVLDFFVEHPEYNLIFAPHVMLFERPFVLTIDKMRIDYPGKLDEKYRSAPNIHIDLGSRASTDMTYTLAANLYLGDVSSQVYEFLLNPRPCVFLNTHNVRFEDNPSYAHWQAGQVINRPSELGASLGEAWNTHAAYRPAQDRLFKQSFDLTDTPSSIRAAHAIMTFMKHGASG